MAEVEIFFEVNPNAIEGGRRDSAINLNDPFGSLREDVLSNRLNFVYNQSDPLSLESQQLLQLLRQQRVGSGLLPVDVSIDADPSITPFPLGCPTGFYQQGNVCIPVIDTYPNDTSGAPPAGKDFPLGRIEDIKKPNSTVAGATFKIGIFMRNINAVSGTFSARVRIDGLSIDEQTDSGVVPKFSRAVIWHDVLMPISAPLGQNFTLIVDLLKLDSASGEFVRDDTASVSIKGPTTTTDTPPTTQECFEVGEVQYCRSDDQTKTGCIIINDLRYCPVTTDPTEPPQCLTLGGQTFCQSATFGQGCFIHLGRIYCPSSEPAPECINVGGQELCESDTYFPGCIIQNNILYCPPAPQPPVPTATLITPESARDGDSFTVRGSNFEPGETVDIVLNLVWESEKSSYNGRTYSQSKTENANSNGEWDEKMKTEEVPHGVSGNAIITATGRSSGKVATGITIIL